MTGPDSRTELKSPLTTVRVGSNSDFRYSDDHREMSLNRGTILLAARDDIVIRAGLVTIKTSRGDFFMSNIPGRRIKIIMLEGKVHVSYSGRRFSLRFGEMVELPYGTIKKPEVIQIDLAKLIERPFLCRWGH